MACGCTVWEERYNKLDELRKHTKKKLFKRIADAEARNAELEKELTRTKSCTGYQAWLIQKNKVDALESLVKRDMGGWLRDGSKLRVAQSRADSLAVELVETAKDTVRLKRIYVNLPTSAKARADKKRILAKAAAILDREKEGE